MIKKISILFVIFANFIVFNALAENHNDILREIVFDTETTGLSPTTGDKIIEIGAIELINHVPTGKLYHQYINPEREVPEKATNIHGLTTAYLKDFPVFADVAQNFMDFIGEDSILIAHNAPFDLKFINYELERNGFKTLETHETIDILKLSKKKIPQISQHNLDALCHYFNIDNSNRTEHGALSDAKLLTKVYLKILDEIQSDIKKEELIRSAIINKQKIKIVYKKKPTKITERVVVPEIIGYGNSIDGKGYPLRSDRIYVRGYCELRKGERTFRLDRIIKVDIVKDEDIK